MSARRLVIAMLLIGATAAVTSPATASAPATDVLAVDVTFTPQGLSAACGFAVSRHVEGTLTIRTFVDLQGNFVREVDRYHLTETLSAHGKTLVGRTNQNIIVRLLGDGTFTVVSVGSDFRLPVPGAGISFGSVGRLVLLFDLDNHFLGVLQDVGNVQGDTAAICAALT